MIHQLIFAQPKPGMSERDFQNYWIHVHAVKYASKIPQIKRYLIDARIPEPKEEKKPLFSGVAEIWLENEKEQLDSLQTAEFVDGARIDEPRWAAFWNTLVLDTNTHIILDAPQPSEQNPSWIKMLVLLKRKSGMSLDNFRQYSFEAHASLVLKMSNLKKYIQCHVRDSFYVVGESRFDSVEMLWFENKNALMKEKTTDTFKHAYADLGNFVEPKYIFSMIAKEHWIIGPDPR